MKELISILGMWAPIAVSTPLFLDHQLRDVLRGSYGDGSLLAPLGLILVGMAVSLYGQDGVDYRRRLVAMVALSFGALMAFTWQGHLLRLASASRHQPIPEDFQAVPELSSWVDELIKGPTPGSVIGVIVIIYLAIVVSNTVLLVLHAVPPAEKKAPVMVISLQ